MTAQLLPATFPTADRAWEWTRHLDKWEVVAVVPSKTRKGRWQVKARKRTEAEEQLR